MRDTNLEDKLCSSVTYESMCGKSDSLELLRFFKQLLYTYSDEDLHIGSHNQAIGIRNYY